MAASETNCEPHFVLFPFMAQGHMIPMIDIAKLLASRGVIVTIVTTPVNAARIKSTINRAKDSGSPIRLVQLQFQPSEELALPQGCESVDMLPSLASFINFWTAANNLIKDQTEDLFLELKPRPTCIIADIYFTCTSEVAKKFNIPRISFHGTGCFPFSCLLSAYKHKKLLETISFDSESFVLPGLPEEMRFTKAQLAQSNDPQMKQVVTQTLGTDLAAFGTIMNSFEELEQKYVHLLSKIKGGSKIWCIGPVSLCNQDKMDKSQRGNIASIDEQQCRKWLDSRQPSSVLYVCLGSFCNLSSPQLIELGFGLEASMKHFIWVIRGIEKNQELETWIQESGFQERIKERGLLIFGWAPQLLVLSHPSVGGFLTHCGWNSTLEGITSGLPLLTWPLFAEQFMNENFIVDVLRIGVRVGAESPTVIVGHEETELELVKKEKVKNAIDMLMDNKGGEGKARTEKAREVGKMAKRAVQKEGSSDINITRLIQDVMTEAQKMRGRDG